MDTPNHGQAADYPNPYRAWYMVVLLTLAYILSFIDRYALGLLVEPIKADLGLSDTEMSVLLGPAFALPYAIMGLPLGWSADRWRRTWIVGAGVAVWSIATMMTGLARTYLHIFFARAFIGAGEATLSPCTMSMIGDSFPKEKRGKPIAVYTAALGLGGAFASLIVAYVLGWAKGPDSADLAIGGLEPWQLTFLVIGAPGLIFAGMFIFLKEPERRTSALDDKALGGNNIHDVLIYVGKNWPVYIGFVSLVCVMTLVAYSQAFNASVFERTWGMAPERFGVLNGYVLLSAGPITVFLSGFFSDRLTKQGMPDAPLKILMAGVLILVPTGVAYPLMPNVESAFAVLWVNTVGIAMTSAVSVTALLNIAPARVRAQIVALYYLAISLTGANLGPPTIGLLSDYVYGEENINYAMASLPVIYGVIPILLIPVIRRLYMQQMERLESGSDQD